MEGKNLETELPGRSSVSKYRGQAGYPTSDTNTRQTLP
jgi:hypothetical protein